MTLDLSPGLSTALAAVRAKRLVDVLRELVTVPTITGSAAESEGQRAMAARLDGMGLDTDYWEIDLEDTLRVADFPGLEAPRTQAFGVVGTWHGADDGPTLVLNGHLDVVPLGDPLAWTLDPWAGVARDGRVFGRGACDMKGGLACTLVALEVLRAAGVTLRGSVALHSVVGEEDGGLGTFATLRRGHTGDAAIICEPTNLAIIPACAGALTFRLTVPGLSAHASVRGEGVDAVEKYLLVHQALRALEARRNVTTHPLMSHTSLPYPLSVGIVRAGDWASSVPDLLVAEGRIGVALGEDPRDARAALEGCLAELDDPWLSEHPITVEWYGGQFAPGELALDAPLLELVRTAHADLYGSSPSIHGATYGSDLRLMSAAGIPTLHYGPGDIRLAHRPDESVPVQDLLDVTRTLALLIARFCGDR